VVADGGGDLVAARADRQGLGVDDRRDDDLLADRRGTCPTRLRALVVTSPVLLVPTTPRTLAGLRGLVGTPRLVWAPTAPTAATPAPARAGRAPGRRLAGGHDARFSQVLRADRALIARAAPAPG
jgi:hypothetical protein